MNYLMKKRITTFIHLKKKKETLFAHVLNADPGEGEI
jgi:hypothetical protein